jgi:hypothetical protein
MDNKETAYKCPLCLEGRVKHTQWLSTHLYICDACPYLAMEYSTSKNAEELMDYLKFN